MSALGEYYKGMSAAAQDQARAAHKSAAASQTGANAQMIGQQGQANLHNAQAGMVKPLGESEIGLQTAQGGYYGAQSNLANQNAAQVAPLAGSEIGLQGHQGIYYDKMGTAALMHGAAAGVSAGAAATSAATGADIGGAQIRQLDQGSGAFATGTSRVSAPGDGTVDTTKARLANGEAVLNRGAAEHLGQPAIQALNAVGMLRMGMVPGQNTQAPQASGQSPTGYNAWDRVIQDVNHKLSQTPTDQYLANANSRTPGGRNVSATPGYAKGTSKAGPKKAAPAKDDKLAPKDAKSAPKNDKSGGGKPSDTPPLDQIDPKMLAAAMQMGLMGQQGGGMPPPGGAPQQMPQGAPMGMM